MNDKEQAKQALRKKAEEISRATAEEAPVNPDEMSADEVRRLLHELWVHQIELEMQNTELRRTRDELEVQRTRYFDLYDLAPVGYCTVSEKGLLLDANLTAINLFGLTRDALIGQIMTRFILEEDQDSYYLFCKKLFAGAQPQSCELRMVKKDGSVFWAHLAATLAGGTSNAPVSRIVVSDISERKQSEEALRESNELLTLFVRNAPIYAYIKEVSATESRVVQASENFEQMIGVKGSAMIGKTMTEMFPADLAAKMLIDDLFVISEGKARELDEDLNGRSYTTLKFPIVQGEKTLLAGFTIDITERKQAEEALLGSLAEKEVLLREVHHRVKNNMAAIIGLFDMQEQGIDDPQTKTALQELSSRVRAMSLVHEKLYHSESLARIDFQDYIESLVAHLRSSFYSEGVNYEIAAQGVEVPLDLAVPCGMIINELIINAVKYAFPEERLKPGQEADRILVTMSHEGGTFSLSVADNGVGLPCGFDLRMAETLGLTLVRMLGEHQLGGRYEVDQTCGTRFTLTFSLRKGRKVYE